jgi:hypothetical protein
VATLFPFSAVSVKAPEIFQNRRNSAIAFICGHYHAFLEACRAEPRVM